MILRTNFFGKSMGKRKSFSDWIYKVFKTKKKIEYFLFKDVYFNPLRINTIIKIISLIIYKKKTKFSESII